MITNVNLAFQWRWRVEWVENGVPMFKDFIQREEQSHLAKIYADEFKKELIANLKGIA